MKKIIFFLALIFMASVSYMNAQNFALSSQDLEIKADKQIERTHTRAEIELSYNSGTINSHGGYNNAAGISHTSACISFNAGQMANYVGGTLHSIETFIGPLVSGVNSFMAGWTAYKVWIKTALDGAIVYEQDVTAQVVLDDWNVFQLTTPYTITGPLVIGFTVTFNLTTGGARYAMPFENANAPYCAGSFNAMYSVSATAHGAGAAFAGNQDRAAAIFGHITATPLPNDLCAVSLTSDVIKLVNTPYNFGIWVFNTGTASQNNFSVELLNASDQVIGTTTVTTALAAGAHKLYNVNYTTPATAGLITVKGRVVLAGDQIPSNNLAPQTLTQRVYPMTPMAYGNYGVGNGIGPATPPAAASAAISYTAANMAPFAGKFLKSIDLAIASGSVVSNGVIWIRSARDGANLYSQPFNPVVGWNFVTLNTPYELTNANTFIGYSIDVTSGNALGVTNNTQVANVNHVAIGTTWYNLSQVTATGNMSIIGEVANAPTTDVTITTAVNPAGSGTVTGGGTYAIGAPVTLTATANSGYTFTNWTLGSTVVSSNSTYTFNASVDATYTANFAGGTPCNDVVLTTTNTSYYFDPLPGWYGWSRNIMLFEASELGAAGNITKVSFNIQAAHASSRPMKIYLMQTSAATLDAQYVWNTIKAQATLLFDASVSFPAGGWQTFTLDNPFAYDGTQNVLLLVEGTGCTTSGGCAAQCYYSTKTNCHWYSRTDGTPPNDGSLAGTRNSNRPNVTFEVCAGTTPPNCNPPTALNFTYTSDCKANLTWTAPGKSASPRLLDAQIAERREAGKADKSAAKSARVQGLNPKHLFTPAAPKATVLFEDFESANVPNMPTGWVELYQGNANQERWYIDDYYYWGNNMSEQYALSEWDMDYTRNTWMVTKAIPMTAGVTYTVKFWTVMGYDPSDGDRLMVRIGNAQTIAALNAGTQLWNTTNGYYDDWTQITCNTFTPTTTGNYYVGFRAYTPSYDGLDILIDDVLITDNTAPAYEVSYNIYRNGVKVNAAPVTTTSYTDQGFNAAAGHTWEVKVICEDESESDAAEKEMPACQPPSSDCDPVTNLAVAYQNGCDAVLTWTGTGGGGTSGTITTPTFSGSAQGGGVAFDMIAGAQDVTINEFKVPIGGTGARTIHAYYRVNSACDNATNPAGWLPIGTGQINVTVSDPSPALTSIPLPVPVVIPAGATYGFYLLTLTNNNDVIKYNASPTSAIVCGTSTLQGSNSDLTIKGGHGLQSATAPFVVSNVWTERAFTGVVEYTIGGGGGGGTYNVYRDGGTTPIATVTTPTHTDPSQSGTHTWTVTTVCDGGGGPGTPGSITTQPASNGYGGVAFDIIAGATDVTITEFQTYFYDPGVATVHVYYRIGTACNNALNPAGWVLVGQTNVTVPNTGTEYKLAPPFPVPGVLTIPAGQTYGIYLATFGATSGRICYYNGGGTCGATTIGSNSNITVKGGHGITTPLAPFGGSVFSERNFAGTISYTVGGGGDESAPVSVTETCGGTIICDDVQVGSGTTGTCRFPLNAFYYDSYSQQIFTQADLGNPPVGATINSVSFQWFYGTPWTFNDVRIYVSHTTKTHFTGTTVSDWVTPSTLTQVFGPAPKLCNNSQAWVTFEFDTPFVYQGGNIVLAMSNHNTSYLTSLDTWRTHSTPNEMTLFYQSDGTQFNVNSPQAPAGGYAGLGRANTVFEICTGSSGGDCNPATNLNVSWNSTCQAELTWSAPGKGKGGKAIILFEGFEDLPQGANTGLPPGWSIAGGDGTGGNWYNLKNTGTPQIIPGHTGNGLMTSASWANVPLTPNNWLITPDVTGATSVTYWVCAQDDLWAQEHYGLYSSTTGTAMGDFTLQFQETMTAKGGTGEGINGDFLGNTLDACTKEGNAAKPQGNWYERTVNLPVGTKYIAWRHFNCSDWFRLNLDDVTVFGDGVTPGDVSYKVYRDGDLQATVTTTSYTDATVNSSVGHTWEVTVVCQGGGESDPISGTLSACDCDADPVSNLQGEYNMDCSIDLTWDAPGGGKSGKGGVVPQWTDPVYDLSETNGKKAEMVANMNATSIRSQAPSTGLIPFDDVPIVELPAMPNLPTRGNTGYAQINYPATSNNYVSFDVTSPMTVTTICPAFGTYGAEYYDGVLYGYTETGTFMKINGSTGAVLQTIPGATDRFMSDMAYDYSTNTMYAIRSNFPGPTPPATNSILWTVNLSTGALTQVTTITGISSAFLIALAVDISGTMYGISVGADGANLYTINKTTGVATLVGATGRGANYAQSMGFDHNDGTLYWAHCVDIGNMHFCTVNINTGLATSLANISRELTGFHVPYTHGVPCNAISNLVANVVNQNNVQLTWSAAAGSPTGYQVLFNGTALATVTTTSYTHSNVATGTHNYCVKALYTGDCIPQSVCQSVTIQEYFGNCLGKIVGTGTTAQYNVPWDTYYNHSYTQQLFDASEIGDPGTITQIAFNYIKAPPLCPYTNQNIYLANTTKSTFSSTTDWIPLSQLTLVYSGNITFDNTNPWFNIDIDPFEYTGGNLALVYLSNHGSYTCSQSTNTFLSHTTAPNKTIYYRVDGSTPINPASPPTASGRYDKRSNTRFIVCPGTLYNVYCGTELIAGGISNNYYHHSGFDNTVSNTWTVRVICDDGGESLPVTITKEACTPCFPATDLSASYTDDCCALLSWAPQFSGKSEVLNYTPDKNTPKRSADQVLNQQPSYNSLSSAQHVPFAPSLEKPNNGDSSRLDGWLKWCVDDIISGQVGWDEYQGNDMTAAIRFLPSELVALGVNGGDIITSVMLGIGTHLSAVNTMELRIWEGGTSVSNPGTLIYSQPITNFSSFLEGAMNQVMLTTPVSIDPTKELRIGWNLVNTAGYPFGRDAYGSNSTQGRNLIQCNSFSDPGGWRCVYNYWFWDWNWSIKAYVQPGNVNIAAAPTNLVATPVGTAQMCKLTWKNPTHTFGGAPLTGITKMVIERGGVQIHEITSGVTPGANMSWTDNAVPTPGYHCYTVYAVTSEGNGLKASDCAVIGNVCPVEVTVSNVFIGDCFSWTIKDNVTNAVILGGGSQGGGGNVSEGTFTGLLTGDATFNLWQHGSYDDNTVLLVIKVNGDQVYSLSMSGGIPFGYSTSAPVPNLCGGAGDLTFNIYRDGELIEFEWNDLTYMDCGDFDPFVGHEWTIRQVCTMFGESDPISVSLLACACRAPENLSAFYLPDCAGAELNWDMPEGGKGKGIIFAAPVTEVADVPVFRGTKPQVTDETSHLKANGVVLSVIPDGKPFVSPPKLSRGVIYDNGPIITHPGVGPGGTDYSSLKPGQNILGTGFTHSLNYKLADDFTLSNPSILTEIDFYGIQQGTNTTHVFTAVYVEIYNGAPNAGGTLIWGDMTTNRLISSNFSGIYRTNGPSSPSMVIPIMTIKADIGGLSLPAGTYWVAVSTVGASISPYTFGNPVTVWNGNPSNPNGLKFQTAGWQPWLDDDGTWEALALPFVIYGPDDPNLAAVPTNLVAAPVGITTKCKLTWTNPTQTVGGAPLTSISKMVVERNGVPVWESTSVTPGQNMTYTDNAPAAGSYNYTVYAVNAAGVGMKASVSALLGNWCTYTFDVWDVFGDGWDHGGKIEITVDGVNCGSVTCPSAGPNVHVIIEKLLPAGTISFTWTATGSTYSSENGCIIYDFNGDVIFSIQPPGMQAWPLNYTFLVYESDCGGAGTLFNIYRDGALIESEWPDTSYTDFSPPLNPFYPYCWEVRAICTGDGKAESDPAEICLPACKDVTEYLVFGVVAAADGNFITGATLHMVETGNAYLEYNTTSVAYGTFEFANVYKATYELTVTKAGYQVHTQTVVVEGHTNLGTIILYDIPYPPTNVVAVELDMTAALVSWNLPATLPVSVAGIIGYKVWRFVPADQGNEGAWTILTNNPVDAMSFTDFGWLALATGDYMYAVKTCYSGNIISAPAFSNVVQKLNNVVYTINISCSNGANPAGASVTLSQGGVPVYAGTSGNTGYTFAEVLQGDYALLITFPDFEDYTADLSITEAGSHTAILLYVGVVEFETDYKIYPNPTVGMLTVERTAAIPATLELYSAAGKYIGTHETAEAIFEINVATLSAGTYFLRIIEGENVTVKSFVKQ